MQEPFERETYKVNIKVKFNENQTKKQLYVHDAQDRNWLPSRIDTLRKGDPAGSPLRNVSILLGSQFLSCAS